MKARLCYISFCYNNSNGYLTFMTLTFTICTTLLHRSSIHSYTIQYKTRLVLYIDCIAKSKKPEQKLIPQHLLINDRIYISLDVAIYRIAQSKTI